MPNKSFYNEKDIPQFQEEVCKKTCVMKGKCIERGENNHFFLMCPHYFNWKMGIKTFIAEQMEYDRLHPEEVEARRKKNLEVVKQIRSERKSTKRSKDN